MTLEEMFCNLYDKYGKDFNWYMIPFAQADGAFAAELKKEIGQDHFLYGKKIWAVAKCESNDDVLYVLRNRIGRNIYYLVHLTYSAQNADGFPRYEEFADIFHLNQRIIAGNAQFTGIAAGRGVRFTTGLLLLGKGLGMRETPIRPHS